MLEQLKSFTEWTYDNLPNIMLAVSLLLGGLGMLVESLMLIIPTSDKKSALEKLLKKLQYLGELVSKITSKLPSNIKKQ